MHSVGFGPNGIFEIVLGSRSQMEPKRIKLDDQPYRGVKKHVPD